MSIIFQCSLNKANWQKEKAILVKAGLMTEWQDNCWARYRQHYLHEWRFTLESGHTNSMNVIITAKQLASIVAIHKLNPSLTERDLLKTLKLNARNRWVIEHSTYKGILE